MVTGLLLFLLGDIWTVDNFVHTVNVDVSPNLTGALPSPHLLLLLGDIWTVEPQSITGIQVQQACHLFFSPFLIFSFHHHHQKGLAAERKC